jgi:hypothetical protein
MSALTSCARAVIEGMSDSGSDSKRGVYADTLAVLLAFIIALVVLSFIGKLLWNGVVVDLFSFAKPAKSFMQIVGLMVFANLIRP